jgi:ribokinase
MEKKYEFVALGDTVTDAFIELNEAEVNEHEGRQNLCMSFGDKIPYKDVTVIPAVGNSANASVGASRLGLSSALITNLGKDYFADQAIDALKAEKVGTDFVTIHDGFKTNYHYVLLFKSERTILIKHEEYPYKLPDIGSPKMFYLSSLGSHSLPFHSVLENYFDEHPDIKFAFQPGTFQIKLGKEKLAGLYKKSYLFFCNKEEAQLILKTKEQDIKELLRMFRDIGPKIPVITDGRNGAFAYDGTDMWSMPMYPDPATPIDRTGAGDSFSSTVTVALGLGMDLPTALSWGPINSMSVVQQIGARAGLLTRDKLEEYLKNAPEDYKPTKL